MKFTYNDVVKWHENVGMIKDSRTQNDITQYLVVLLDGTQVWTGEMHIMRYTPNYVAKIGDKVTYYDKGIKSGIVVDVLYDAGFKYLVEAMNRERFWKLAGECDVHQS